jgi:hypothetical protein
MSQQEAQFHTVRFLLNKTVFDDNINNVILYYYWDNIGDKKLVMLDWIDTTILEMVRDSDKNNKFWLSRLAWYNISKNPNAISYIEKNIPKIAWNGVVKNRNAIHLLEKHTLQIGIANCWNKLFCNIYGIDFFFNNTDKIMQYNYNPNWNMDDYGELITDILEDSMDKLCKNPNIIDLINSDDPNTLQNGLPIDWNALSKNPNAIDLLKTNQDKINWSNLSKNPNAIYLLKMNEDKIDWDCLSRNPNAIELLEANHDKINWLNLSKNPNAIHLLEANEDKIDWSNLSKNPNAIKLLEANKDKIQWISIYKNPSIFQYKTVLPIY